MSVRPASDRGAPAAARTHLLRERHLVRPAEHDTARAVGRQRGGHLRESLRRPALGRATPSRARGRRAGPAPAGAAPRPARRPPTTPARAAEARSAAAEGRHQRQVPLDVVARPVAGHALVVEERAAALAEPDAARDAGGGEEERRPQRAMRRHHAVETLRAQPARHAQPGRATPRSRPRLSSHSTASTSGWPSTSGTRLGSHQHGQTPRRDPAPERGQERRGEDDVAQEARLRDQQRRSRGLIRGAAPHRSA